jgi:gas vesicle protein
MSKKNNLRNVAIGGALAAAAGYVTGILTAPKSGKETRKDIETAAVKAKTDAEAQLKKLHSELGDLITTGKGKMNDVKDAVQKDLGKAVSQAEVAKEKARDLLSALHEGDAQDKDLQKAIDEVKKATEHLKAYLEKKSSPKE